MSFDIRSDSLPRRARRVLPLAVLAALLAPQLSAAPQSDAPGAVYRLAVGTYDDVFDKVPNTRVLIEQGAQSTLVSSASNGVTPFVSVVPGRAAEVTIFEHSTPQGVVLGQRKLVDVPAAPTNGYSLFHSELTAQPLAVPVTISSSQIVSASPRHAAWAFMRDDVSASYNFQASVGVLWNPSEIQGFLDYYDTTIKNQWARGLVIRCDYGDLGAKGLAFSLHYTGGADGSIPAIDVLGIDPTTGALVDPGIKAFALGVDTQREVLYVHVDGKLVGGNNVVLIGSNTDAAALPDAVRDRNRGEDRSSPSGGGTDATPVDCKPVAPAPGPQSCTPPASKSDDGCPAATPFGPQNCATETLQVSDPVCGGGGVSKGSKISTRVKASMSVKVKIGLPGVAEEEVTAGVEHEQAVETSISYTFAPGTNNCGQCMAEFIHVTTCGQMYTVNKMRGWIWTECYPVFEATRCVKFSGTSSGTCDRTCK